MGYMGIHEPYKNEFDLDAPNSSESLLVLKEHSEP